MHEDIKALWESHVKYMSTPNPLNREDAIKKIISLLPFALIYMDKLAEWLTHYGDCPMPDDYTCDYKKGGDCGGRLEEAKDCWIRAAREDTKC